LHYCARPTDEDHSAPIPTTVPGAQCGAVPKLGLSGRDLPCSWLHELME
jgi:hypothetical protein